MQCPECQSDNPADARFCNNCGSQLEIACPKCSKANPPDSNFCNGCGHSLVQEEKPDETPEPPSGGERKHVTVLFSDLSGYTAMSEKLDPEEVKEIMTRIFDRIKGVIAKYDGFIEKFAGDAVMAIFGVPKAHEDDPVRAIRAAREIHDLVRFISPEVELKTGTPLVMHSGINTGLVVTGEVNPDKGTHGVAGDPLNLASRLCGLALGEKINNTEVIGYACTWLSWTYTELGRLEDGRLLGLKAHEISKELKADKYLYFKSLGGIGYNAWISGQRDVAFDAGNQLLSYGRKHSNIRSSVMGYFIKGCSYFMNAELEPAIECFEEAVRIAADPYYGQFPRLMLGMGYVLNGDIKGAEGILQHVLDFSRQYGTETIGTVAQVFLGLCAISNGNLNRGIKMMEAGQKPYLENDSKWRHALVEGLFGKVYLQMTDKDARISPVAMAKNIGFLLTNLPVVNRKVEQHFTNAIELAQEVNARGILAQAYLDFGIYHRTKKRPDKARECITRAIALFDECKAEGYLKQAEEVLGSLDDRDGQINGSETPEKI